MIFALVISTLGTMISLATVLSSWNTPRIILTSCSSRGSPSSSRCIARLSVPFEPVSSSSDWDDVPISMIRSCDLVTGLRRAPIKVVNPNRCKAMIGPPRCAIVRTTVSVIPRTTNENTVTNMTPFHAHGSVPENLKFTLTMQDARASALSIENAETDWSAFRKSSSSFSLPSILSLLQK